MTCNRLMMPFHIGVGLALAAFRIPASVRAQETHPACDARDKVLKQPKRLFLPVAPEVARRFYRQFEAAHCSTSVPAWRMPRQRPPSDKEC
jgi:hypothetical protein